MSSEVVYGSKLIVVNSESVYGGSTNVQGGNNGIRDFESSQISESGYTRKSPLPLVPF